MMRSMATNPAKQIQMIELIGLPGPWALVLSENPVSSERYDKKKKRQKLLFPFIFDTGVGLMPKPGVLLPVRSESLLC